ncbi:MAG: AlpA family transcriptional regulator [Moraxellaceae bacterium]|nr:AlpA family transcriptional regulator [Moraxellaceae bacterium]
MNTKEKNVRAEDEILLRRTDVENITGLTRSGIYEGMRKGTFPEPVRLGNNSVAWVNSEIRQWIQDLIKKRDDNK